MADEPERKDPEEGENPPTGRPWPGSGRRAPRRTPRRPRHTTTPQEASKTELQNAKEAAAKAEKEVEALKTDAELRELRRKIAKKAGIPENLVFGAYEDEMEDVHTVDGLVGLRVGCVVVACRSGLMCLITSELRI